MFFSQLAHAGEEHSDSIESIIHTATPWYIAVPVFLIIVAMISYLTWLLSGKKPDVVLIVLAFVLLISGFTLFNVSAAISVIAITGGIIVAGILTFGGLGDDTKQRKK